MAKRKGMRVKDKFFERKNIFTIEVYDPKGNLVSKEDISNLITTIGKTTALDILFGATAKISTWYFGLINNSGFSAVAAADTMSSHAGWAEFTNYDETTRQEWDTDAASAGSISNTAQATFTINATGNLYGLFVTSGSAKSGTTGILWAATSFNAVKAVDPGSSIKLTYNVNA